MKTRIVKPLVWALLSLVLVVAAYLKGRTDVWTAEFKVYHGNLTIFVDAEHAPELKAFLKARYYYLANKIPKSWLEGAAKDYGTVTTNELNRIVAGKGPTSAQEEYQKFKNRGVSLETVK